MSELLDRAEALHTKAGMPWSEAERLALSEAGIDDDAIDELCGECAPCGSDSLLTGDDIREFARSVLVHGSALFNTEAQRAAPELLAALQAVLNWIDDNCETTGFEAVEAMADAALAKAGGELFNTTDEPRPGVGSI